MRGQIRPTGQSQLTPALHWGQSHLFQRHVESYLPSYLKASSASPSALSSSQSPVDRAPCQLSHWRLHYGPCICSSVLFAVPVTGFCLSVSYLCTPVSSAPKAVDLPATMLLGLLLILVASSQVPSLFDCLHSFLHSCIRLALIEKALGEQLLCARKGPHRAQ